MNKKIINCHTHIFTGDHVPPYLGKTLMPFPFYYLLNIRLIMYLVRNANGGWISASYYWIKTPADNFIFCWQSLTEHNLFTRIIAWLIKTCIVILCFIFMISFLYSFFEKGLIRNIFITILNLPFVPSIAAISPWYKILILVFGLILIKWVRNIAKVLFFAAFKFSKTILGQANLQLLGRYYSIAMFSKDKTQQYIFSVLKNAYPSASQFVVLPMDMDYAGAGKPRVGYLQQLNDLIELKKLPSNRDTMLPFVFADPRRIKEQPEYYDKIIECLEQHGFKGIKIYPALGYYPFDKYLLELFLYACKNEIPILTHCIRGIIFYRGMKLKEWDYHPVFNETKKGDEKLKLSEFKNINFINNFTHPLNYLCLLDPELLKTVLFNLDDDAYSHKVYGLYGFIKNDSPATSVMATDLRNLKLCFGHFGGEDEWAKYIERDRSPYESHFNDEPLYHQDFDRTSLGATWHRETWYSIIRNIMMNPDYPNVYADISFIIYDEKIVSLLKASLNVERLQDKILFGTDFYVVRQKGTDKKFWLDITTHLSGEEITRIAVSNPEAFLHNNLEVKA
jgi:predicted TIM-barrel fold metal-dependent hydrolase